MSWDLALASSGDLVFTPGDLMFSPSADLQGISGTDQVEQRMITRLKIHRGSWTYDDDGSFGSQLFRLTSMTPQTATAQATAYIQEALRDITEIQVDEVRPVQIGSSLALIIDYHITEETISMSDENERQLEVVISGGPE